MLLAESDEHFNLTPLRFFLDSSSSPSSLHCCSIREARLSTSFNQSMISLYSCSTSLFSHPTSNSSPSSWKSKVEKWFRFHNESNSLSSETTPNWFCWRKTIYNIANPTSEFFSIYWKRSCCPCYPRYLCSLMFCAALKLYLLLECSSCEKF